MEKIELLIELGEVLEDGRETVSITKIKELVIVSLWFTLLNVWNKALM